jgi:hypothetical protein
MGFQATPGVRQRTASGGSWHPRLLQRVCAGGAHTRGGECERCKQKSLAGHSDGHAAEHDADMVADRAGRMPDAGRAVIQSGVNGARRHRSPR